MGNMKLKLNRIFMFCLALLAPCAVWGQSGESRQVDYTPSEVELITNRYVDSYDSLINTFYLRRIAKHRLISNREFDVEEFDAIPDSVLIARLRALHTVIPMTFNKEVRAHIRFYLRYIARRIDVMMMLSEYYRPTFEDALSRYGVPEELKNLAIVESALNPKATSRAGAAGLWQFIYSTGRDYDLEVNSVVDERRDPYKSSVAAAHFLSRLHRVFGDWTLAIAAYNCGPGSISKAIARSGGKRDFWELYPYLPRETRGYIPAFIAVTYVMNYYPQHGIRPVKLEVPMHTDTVGLHHDVLFHYVEEFTKISDEELRTLNPQYRADYIPASTGNYAICLPSNKMALFISHLDTIYARSQDSLSRRPITVEPDKGSVRSSKKDKKSNKGGGGRYHTVKKGETLSSIARQYGISLSQLKKMNGIKKDKITVGQRLKVRG